jgi:hypothetical protein
VFCLRIISRCIVKDPDVAALIPDSGARRIRRGSTPYSLGTGFRMGARGSVVG